MAAGLPARLTAAEGRRFAWTLAAAFAAFGTLMWWKDVPLIGFPAAAFSVLLIGAGMVAPTTLGPIFRGWMRLGLAISTVTTPIILGVLYFLVITPTALIMRLFGRRPLAHRAESDSYWQPAHSGGRSDLTRQF